MFQQLKQFKDLRDKAKELQKTLASEQVEGSAAWGKVKVSMDGNMAVTAVSINEELLQQNQKSSLETAVKDACNDALKKAQMKAVTQMRKMGGLPGLQ